MRRWVVLAAVLATLASGRHAASERSRSALRRTGGHRGGRGRLRAAGPAGRAPRRVPHALHDVPQRRRRRGGRRARARAGGHGAQAAQAAQGCRSSWRSGLSSRRRSLLPRESACRGTRPTSACAKPKVRRRRAGHAAQAGALCAGGALPWSGRPPGGPHAENGGWSGERRRFAAPGVLALGPASRPPLLPGGGGVVLRRVRRAPEPQLGPPRGDPAEPRTARGPLGGGPLPALQWRGGHWRAERVAFPGGTSRGGPPRLAQVSEPTNPGRGLRAGPPPRAPPAAEAPGCSGQGEAEPHAGGLPPASGRRREVRGSGGRPERYRYLLDSPCSAPSRHDLRSSVIVALLGRGTRREPSTESPQQRWHCEWERSMEEPW
ncbi:unnamed protein product [Prorocentrum cordatum]|uniref:Uncharacterized protein n=1 Tax=Prorocentrum cordatum TaxID=2364126 RepID=A0ABN9Y6N2_9DINO|nr:unnamed protein product [Polarella glacialis]